MYPRTLIFHSMHFYNSATQNDIYLFLYTLIKLKNQDCPKKSSPQKINIPYKLYQKMVRAKLENKEIYNFHFPFLHFLNNQTQQNQSKASKKHKKITYL